MKGKRVNPQYRLYPHRNPVIAVKKLKPVKDVPVYSCKISIIRRAYFLKPINQTMGLK